MATGSTSTSVSDLIMPAVSFLYLRKCGRLQMCLIVPPAGIDLQDTDLPGSSFSATACSIRTPGLQRDGRLDLFAEPLTIGFELGRIDFEFRHPRHSFIVC